MAIRHIHHRRDGQRPEATASSGGVHGAEDLQHAGCPRAGGCARLRGVTVKAGFTRAAPLAPALAAGVLALLLAAGTAETAAAGAGAGLEPAASGEDAPGLPFETSSIAVEHAFTVAHGGDLSPSYTRTYGRTVSFSLATEAGRRASFSGSLALLRELTPGETTYDRELLVSDLEAAAALSLPLPDAWPLSLDLGLALGFPTSKASRAETLRLSLMPSFAATLTAPVLDGLSLGWTLSPAPRLHRYATASYSTPRPCSRSAGCLLGETVDSGERNTAFLLLNEVSLALLALRERLSVSATLQLAHGWKYRLSPSPRFPESVVHDADNGSGSPATLEYSFVFDVSYDVHPGIGLSLGLWTPGGMRPDGDWYNPLLNRYSQLYATVTLRPVAAIQTELRRARPKATAMAPSPQSAAANPRSGPRGAAP
jgi:hypothetical protein